jgi:hypothetical protein
MKKICVITMALFLFLLAIVSVESSIFVSPLLPNTIYIPVAIKPIPTPTPMPPPPLQGVGCITQVDYACEDVITSGVEWMHDWSMNPKDCGIPVVCQAWGLGWENRTPDPRCSLVLLWNEPSIAAQADISAQTGAGRWLLVEQRRDEWGTEISTPCDSEEWLTEWANEFKADRGRWPVFDRVCIHSYPGAFTAEDAAMDTMSAVTIARDWSLSHGGDGRVVLHEFGVWPAWGEGVTEEYIRLVVPMLQDSGAMYAWFGLSGVGDYMTDGSPWYAPYYDTSLVDTDTGELTAFGIEYANLAQGW